MKSSHTLYFKNSCDLTDVEAESVDLVVTSPPYPMIEMWDPLFIRLRPEIGNRIADGAGMEAFEQMHRILDATWQQIAGVLKPGGILCINIGDATRTLKERFVLYPNHARILDCLLKLGLTPLPAVLWRKPTNAPTKFMGSGMIPPGAYVTLEHEYILILRKGALRRFPNSKVRENRRCSAYFWEERNVWFSDIWADLPGSQQRLRSPNTRSRSAAFPFELPYRLINMFSVRGDRVLDPFLGTGTTVLAAMASGRDSIGFELEDGFREGIYELLSSAREVANVHNLGRIARHLQFVRERTRTKGPLKYRNIPHGFPVMTRQEQSLLIPLVQSVAAAESNTFEVEYDPEPYQSPGRNAFGENSPADASGPRKLKNVSRSKER